MRHGARTAGSIIHGLEVDGIEIKPYFNDDKRSLTL